MCVNWNWVSADEFLSRRRRRTSSVARRPRKRRRRSGRRSYRRSKRTSASSSRTSGAQGPRAPTRSASARSATRPSARPSSTAQPSRQRCVYRLSFQPSPADLVQAGGPRSRRRAIQEAQGRRAKAHRAQEGARREPPVLNHDHLVLHEPQLVAQLVRRARGALEPAQGVRRRAQDVHLDPQRRRDDWRQVHEQRSGPPRRTAVGCARRRAQPERLQARRVDFAAPARTPTAPRRARAHH